MYQYSTFYPLASSKNYFDSVKKCSSVLKKCIKMTNEFREKNLQPKLLPHEIEAGQRLLRVTPQEDIDILSALGPERGLDTQNLEKSNYYVLKDE